MAKPTKEKKANRSKVPAKAVAKGIGKTQKTFSWNRDWVWGLVLVAAVLLAYSPVWWAGYVWDDDQHLTANPCMSGLLGLKEIWTTSAARICPLVLTTFWMEHLLWGLPPLPYHVVNVLMHAAGAIALWRVLLRLQVPGAWWGSALWAFHPIQVESVAWISEMKNTESCLFYLLSILFFLRWLKAGDLHGRILGNWNYVLMLIFAAMALASKSSTVILPVVLCLCAWWIEGRWQWRQLARIAPVFLMSLVPVVVSIWTQKMEGGADPSMARSWPERFVTAGYEVWFYLGKLLWPYPLITVYPRWQIDATQWSSYLPLLAVIVVLMVLWLYRGSWSRPWFFIFAYFLVALLPVLGFVDHFFLKYSFVADHFQYLASIGPLALAGVGLARLDNLVGPGKRWFPSTIGAGILFVLGTSSWFRAWTYESDVTLWDDTLASAPDSWVAYNNLGNALMKQGQVNVAMEQYQKSVAINPNFAFSLNNLGTALTAIGQGEEALVQFQKALEIEPNNAAVRCSLGNALLQLGRTDEAVAQYQKSLEIDPRCFEALNNLGTVYLRQGQFDQAREQYQKALEINPNNDSVHCSLGNALFRMGRLDEAIAQYQQTLEINPDNVAAQNNLPKAQNMLRQNAGGK